jgi:hypothetical protein
MRPPVVQPEIIRYIKTGTSEDKGRQHDQRIDNDQVLYYCGQYLETAGSEICHVVNFLLVSIPVGANTSRSKIKGK